MVLVLTVVMVVMLLQIMLVVAAAVLVLKVKMELQLLVVLAELVALQLAAVEQRGRPGGDHGAPHPPVRQVLPGQESHHARYGPAGSPGPGQ